ncbi:hypothetical protein WA1_26730 [Scytonema hofmannii PCC 7110]|uniref:Uncharacterized protein n=1 Tax=Scytonema hofmannii PCC 7110 TaxID=128403 RepID=A0A139X6U8_9CYAN|nr:hypothetical protein [Scytonema hofmannii]KYC40410.1 hypothetical protein WA1_26730 [Scytonema hofmannii PCC 7110]
MSYSKRRKQSVGHERKSVEEIYREVPLWKSPFVWLCGSAGALLIGVPLLLDGLTHRVAGVLMVDVSQSNQPFKESLKVLCRQYSESLVEGDTRIQGKFADVATILGNQKFIERDRLLLQKQCQQVMVPPSGVGKIPGTSLLEALSRMETEIQHQQSLGNTQPVAAIVAINSAELVNQQPQNFSLIKSKIERVVQKGGAVAIIGSSVNLENQLSQQLMQVKNTQICTYADSQTCIEGLFEIARK